MVQPTNSIQNPTAVVRIPPEESEGDRIADLALITLPRRYGPEQIATKKYRKDDNPSKALAIFLMNHLPMFRSIRSDMELSFPIPYISEEALSLGLDYGVSYGYRELEKSVSCHVLLTSSILATMEKMFSYGFVDKVQIFVMNQSIFITKGLEDPLQKAEYWLRLITIMYERIRYLPREQAVMAIASCGDEISTLSPLIIKMAQTYAEDGDFWNTLYWLKRGGASSGDFDKAAEEFFFNGLFDDGVRLWKQKPSISTSEGQSFVDQIALRFQDEGQEVLNYKDDYRRTKIILRALCHIGKMNEALAFAKQCSVDTNQIGYLFTLVEYAPDDKFYEQCLESIREFVAKSQDRASEVMSIYRSKLFSVTENINTIQLLLPTLNECGSVLWEMACGISIKNNKTVQDLRDSQAIVLAFRSYLMEAAPPNGYEYWCKIIQSCVHEGLVEEALQTGEMWKQHRKTHNYRDKYTIVSEIEFLTRFGIFQIAVNRIESGLADIEEAFEIQKIDKEYSERVGNCQGYLEASVVDVAFLSAIQSNFTENRYLRDKFREPWKKLDYAAVAKIIRENF